MGKLNILKRTNLVVYKLVDVKRKEIILIGHIAISIISAEIGQVVYYH